MFINKLKTKFNGLQEEFTTPFHGEMSPQEINKYLQKFYLLFICNRWQQ